MTVPALGSIRRLNTPGNPVMTVPSPYTRSAVRCGREVCPPGECRVISTVSAADVIAPARIATLPTSRRGSQCKAKILVTPAIAPVATTSMAPPGMTSSAGWKIRRTPDGSDGAELSAMAAPSKIAVCASCPQACATFGTVDEYAAPVRSCIGRASMSARSATRGPSSGPKSQVTPVPPGKTFGLRPASANRAATYSVVACSWRANSGCSWMCRRHRTSASVFSASHCSATADRDSLIPSPSCVPADPVPWTARLHPRPAVSRCAPTSSLPRPQPGRHLAPWLPFRNRADE
ncbi:Uncharacterised protein [Mycobacteroides abscessus subsp. abscessus]|nr:Uncharacterised protein [Mycobacteroides abscessus subsp. abscessus]